MTFNYITKKIINTDNNFFSPNYDNSDTVNPIFKILFYGFVNNNTYTSKFNVFKENLNSFLDFSRDEFIQYFCKIQKTYHSLSRFAYLYKYKKSIMSVTTDMGLNDININDKNILCIYHINSRYLFNINDLLKIINVSLINNYMFFAEPLPSKNPYNNLPFTKSNLYNIYIFIKHNTNIYDDLFFKFFKCDFNLSIFYNNYEYLLREYSIKNFIKNCTEKEIVNKIKEMISNYNNNYKSNTINIHDEFPKNKLIKIMKPYLLLYLNSCYSLIPIIKKNSNFDLKNKLRNFQKFNPQFGRRLVKMGLKPYPNFKTKSYIKGYVFNDKHIVFNSNDNNKFLSNHLKYDEINHHVDIGINYFNRLHVVHANNYRLMGNYIQNENSNSNNDNNYNYNDNNDNNDNDSSSSDSSSDIIQQNIFYDENNDEQDEDSIS
jgi:hypothetical protein